MSISTGHHHSLSHRASALLCLLSSPCRQRRLSAPAPRSVEIVVQSATFLESPSHLGRQKKPVSFGCAPEGAKTVPRVARGPSNARCRTDDRMEIKVCRRATLSRRSFLAVRRGRRLASADSSPLVVACSRRALFHPPLFFRVSGSVVALQSGSGIAIQDAQPVGQHGRCAIKPRSAGYLERWGSYRAAT